ncbi:DNA polymerase III subunit delta [Spirochaetia bacterium]|nr:DNA polymerase III subunit delta [Spirochaetia bacterium]
MAKSECFLFLGPEIGRKQDEIEKIRFSLKEKYNAPPEETSFYAGDTPVSDILSVLLSGSLFSDARLIFIKNADQLKKQDETAGLCSYIKSPGNDTTLIFISEENKIDTKIENAAGKNKKIFWEMFENEKPTWVRDFFKREGFVISQPAIDAILEMVENTTDALRKDCSALVSFFYKRENPKKPITADEVEKLLSHNRSESAFTLFSAIAAGNFLKSIEITRSLLSADEAAASIFAGLIWCFRRFRDYCELSQNGTMNDFELKRIGINFKTKTDYGKAASHYGMDSADKFIALCAEYDLLTRSSGTALQDIIMDLFLVSIFKTKKA